MTDDRRIPRPGATWAYALATLLMLTSVAAPVATLLIAHALPEEPTIMAKAKPKSKSAKRVPWLGDDVYYHDADSTEVRTARVVGVDRPGDPEGPLDLFVMSREGYTIHRNVPFAAGDFGHWRFPPERPR